MSLYVFLKAGSVCQTATSPFFRASAADLSSRRISLRFHNIMARVSTTSNAAPTY